jgi:hypothetical protein
MTLCSTYTPSLVWVSYCYLLTKLRSDLDSFSASLHGQLRGIASDLYLTPESRTKLKLEAPDPDGDLRKKYGV